MNLSELFTQDLNKAKADASQAAGNALFNFLGMSLQEKAEDAGIELKSQFAPKVEENPKVSASVEQMASAFGASGSILLVGAVLVGAFLFLGKKKAA